MRAASSNPNGSKREGRWWLPRPAVLGSHEDCVRRLPPGRRAWLAARAAGRRGSTRPVLLKGMHG